MEESQSDHSIFSVRIVSIDYYMAPPIPDLDISFSSFQGGKVNEVPVIRIYGSTPAGQKTCLHVHQVLPYFYVACSDILLQMCKEGDEFTRDVSLAIEKALKLKANAGSKRQHVHCCSLVRARKFYGYHSSEELFMKIYLYYPHDVPRAASLFLGGAVLDRCLQPHESHIPFLLQFLVDYNLYGMGHIHLSKVKFRQPVPGVVSSWKAMCGSQHKQEANFNCDPSNPPLWLASTIPSGWMWQSPSDFDASLNQGFHVVKRQSTCELEGDATMDDILNQQFKLYCPLSQTGRDVKMVQSLIPIWEEERERSGMHEAGIHPDPGRPLPEDVLKTLSPGLEFDNQLLELCKAAQSSFRSIEKDRRSGHEGNLVERGQVSLIKSGEPLDCSLEANEKFSPSVHNSPCKEGNYTVNDQRIGASPQVLPVDEIQASDNIESLGTKNPYKESFGLLCWFASSQAAEDINSDDELACETILSPLLPVATIDEVFEKANLDYESQSQKECQDILDSVEELTVSEREEGKEDSSEHNHLAHSQPDKMIPQMDGSCDDQSRSLHAVNCSFLEINGEEKFYQQKMPPSSGASFRSKRKSNKSLWGPLKLSTSQNINKSLLPLSLNMAYSYRDEAGRITDERGNEEYDPSHDDTGTSCCKPTDGNTLVGCSLRELMRKKRCHRVESLDHGPPGIEKGSSDTILSRKRSECLSSQTEVHKMRFLETSKFKNVVSDQQTVVQEDCDVIYCSGCGNVPLSSTCDSLLQPCMKQDFSVYLGPPRDDSGERCRADVYMKSGSSYVHSCQDNLSMNTRIMKCAASDEDWVGKKSKHLDAFDSDTLSGCLAEQETVGRNKHIFNRSHGSTIFMESVPQVSPNKLNFVAAGSGNSGHVSVKAGTQPLSLTGMTICEKLPVINQTDERSKKTLYSPHILTHSCLEDEHIHERASAQESASRDLSPFFMGDDQEEIRSQDKCHRCDDIKICQEATIRVPTHYLNDGSCLYILTPAFSPPSIESAYRWLYQDARGFSSSLTDVKAPPADASSKPLLESESFYSKEPALNNLSEHYDRNLDETCAIRYEVTTPGKSGDNIVEVKECVSDSLDFSQISGPDGKLKPTPLSQIGFRDPASVGAGQQLTLLSIEVLAESRSDLRPDPRYDAVNVVCLAILDDTDPVPMVYMLLRSSTFTHRSDGGISGCKVMNFPEEKCILNCFIEIFCLVDPDIIMGWDIQGGSLGFLAERACFLGIKLLGRISRTPSETKVATSDFDFSNMKVMDNLLAESHVTDMVFLDDSIIDDEWGRTHASGLHVGGRIVLNIWRLIRGEINLNMYTIEAVAEAVLRWKVPSIPWKVLTKWFVSGPGQARHRAVTYVKDRAVLNIEIMRQLDMINRTSELSRVFGIDFFSVLSRGSQYRVESMLVRLAHTQNYLAISPGNDQVASQPAMECIPLVMEPESGFYADPVVVLDFQSLYPSMIIAYNLCFCTCLGKVVPSKDNMLGVSSFSPDLCFLQELKHELLVTPNGVMYVPPKVRKGVLPRMLEELLSTRIMVKQAMKMLAPSQKVLQRIFNARQLALKLIANVTYGYTAAGFSGRMPCAELADSIVQCGRKTLENAISFVNMHDKWKARVIYGDTDSMFVLLRGRSIEESFQIGQEIADAISAMNPNPVTLKMEKVYHPCFLLTKKRYVGYSYASPDQKEPLFDAKGIETVRRDTCGAVAKTLEQSLRIFFERQDILQVKEYLQHQWTRILSGRISLQDFVFAKEVRLGTYSTGSSSSLPPAAIVATKAMRADPRAEPRYAERVPYLVVHGEPGARLVDMVVDPLDLLALDSPFRLNDLYYITKQIIPALQRVFGLVGADLSRWFLEMPRPVRETVGKRQSFASNTLRTRIDYYYLSKHCVVCGKLVQGGEHLCNVCAMNRTAAVAVVTRRTSKLERDMQHLAAICRHCGGGDWITESGVKCTSLACSVFYERRKVQKELHGLSGVSTELDFYPKCMVEWF